MKTYKIISLIVLLILTTQLSAKVYPDSIQEVSKSQYRIRQGFNIDISGGVGFGRYGYKQIFAAHSLAQPHVTNTLTFPTFNGSLGVNYYFLDWLGVGTGAQFSTYANTAKVNKPWEYRLQSLKR